LVIAIAAACGALIALVVPLNAARAAAPPSVKAWDARLEKLRPSEPLAYYELAEEVADGAATTDRELARHLYALAGVLDPAHLGRSACLALSDLEENPAAKQRLLALASLLGSGMETQLSSAPTIAATQPSVEASAAALAVAEALSRYRRGQGGQALNALKKPAADELLKQNDRMLPGGYNRFMEDCKVYKAQKPLLSADEVTRMLRLESALLAGVDRSWSTELLISGGAPLIEVDPGRLAESLGVDARKPLYRNGHWVENR
jgi:hypothetical protein